MHSQTAFKHTYIIVALLLLTIGSAADWPMWRHDALRSGTTPERIADKLHIEWTRDYPQLEPAWEDVVNRDRMPYDLQYEPIVVGDTLYFGSNRNDRLTALDTRTGAERWRFYADGPIRFAPVHFEGRLYFTSDDGNLYCLDAQTGKLLGKIQPGPRPWKVLGNSRLVSTWPARGGPVVQDSVVYYSAGIWPFMGTYFHAVDASTGETVWLNDGDGSTFREQPHGGATSFAGMGPQGAILASKDRLLVPGGRSVPACLDIKNGREQYCYLEGTPGVERKREGASQLASNGKYYFNYRGVNTIMYDLDNGEYRYIWEEKVIPVLDQDNLYMGNNKIRAYDLSQLKKTRKVEEKKGREYVYYQWKMPELWSVEADATGTLMKAGNRLYAGGKDLITVLELSDDGPAKIVDKIKVEGKVVRLLAADDRLFAVTEKGRIYCFGPEPTEPTFWKPEGYEKAESTDLVNDERLNKLVDRMGETLSAKKGYCLAFGLKDGRLIEAIARRLGLHVIGVDPDPKRIEKLRREFDEKGIYGKKIALAVGTPDSFCAPPYLATLAVTEDSSRIDAKSPIGSIYRSLRPYGGSLWMPYINENGRENLVAHIRSLELPSARIHDEVGHYMISREGPLEGAGTWTHQNGDIASTSKSNDQLVKLPMGLLWFGGNRHSDVLPRHAHGPTPQVLGGRLFIEGVDRLSARDVYTGTVLWRRVFDGLDTFNVYFSESYELDPLFQGYNQRHIPGANSRGANYVVTDDTVYFLVNRECHLLDPSTGKTRTIFTLPKKIPKSNPPSWGFLGVYEDLLIAGEQFVPYSKLYGIKPKEKWGAYDHGSSKKLVVMDRHTGKVLWSRDSQFALLHNGIIAGNGRIYVLDRYHPTILKGLKRRGEEPEGKPTLMALDAKTGRVVWQSDKDVFGTALAYDRPNDILLLTGKSGPDMLDDEPRKELAALRGKNGKQIWHSKLTHGAPVMIRDETVYFNGGGGCDLLTGEKLMRRHALTDEKLPWDFRRFHGCNSLMMSEHLMTFRSGSAGFFDITRDGGTGNFGGFKSGCSANLVCADGVLNAPDYTRTCTCSYPNQTSLALIHNPEIEYWTFNSYTTKLEDKKRVHRIGLNFGAPGDRRADNGTLWLDTPSVGGDSPNIPVLFSGSESIDFYKHNQMQLLDAPKPWITASGVEGVEKIEVLLNAQGKSEINKTIATGADDAEESNKDKKVTLTNEYLSITGLNGDNLQGQTVGLRFTDLDIPPGAKIVSARLQFESTDRRIAPARFDIAMEATDNASPFEATPGNLSQRVATSKKIPWKATPWVGNNRRTPGELSPNLGQLLQEIVDRPGWKQGSSVAFLLTGDGFRKAKSYEHGLKEVERLKKERKARKDKKKKPKKPLTKEEIEKEEKAFQKRLKDILLKATGLTVEYLTPDPIKQKSWKDLKYTVTLHFLEPDQTVEPGQRVFDVRIQGEPVLEKFDIVAEANGPKRGITRRFEHIRAANLMSFELIPRTEKRPIISGIEIVEE
jgi:outer membrane protein assembly factor BamB